MCKYLFSVLSILLFLNVCIDSEVVDNRDSAPSSHRLAAGLGLHAHDLQIRKASFFGYEEEEIGKYSLPTPSPPSTEKKKKTYSILVGN